MLFCDNSPGLVADLTRYRDVFLNRDAPATSMLAERSVREELMPHAAKRRDYELALMGPYAPLTLPSLRKFAYGEKGRKD
jgi:hypothetical protein